ncbi:MAG: 1-acyl-sn-glycerol-3-phosphate acyltransferase [Armatimonadetes bacterium]|nr:1-acyl-sn-glycerol-3-phosphate acyltransferase [Armatimonadota bacterium]
MPDAEDQNPDLPPIDGRVHRIISLAYSRIMRYREHITETRFFTAADEERLHALRGKRVLFLPNHPTPTDPQVMFGLSKSLGERFRFAAMQELFEGAIGAVVSRIGAFPIRRGTPDRAALKKCQASLLIPGGKLVLFAEGEAHGQNDYLLPLNSGFAQVAFWAMDKLDDTEPDADIILQPVAIKYRYVDADDARRAIDIGLASVEEDLGIASEHGDSLYRRTRRAALAVLSGIETEYGLAPNPEADTETRLAALYSALEARVVAMLHIVAPKEEFMVHRMRTLFIAAYAFRDKLAEGATRYAHRLQERREWVADVCLADLRRVENFMGVRENRLEADATLEQIGELLVRLEVETHGTKRTRPLCDATIALAGPISAAQTLPAYRTDKRGAVTEVTREVTARLHALLNDMAEIGTPATDA